MDIRQLTYYAAIFEHRNLSRAAGHCNVAQSAISHHLANLESELGVTLFLRKPRGMEPTAAGIKLYDHARLILRAVQSAEQDIRQESEVIAGDIAIGLPYSVMKAIGLPLMQAVLKDYPDVRLSVVESLSGGTFSSLLSSEVDISLFYNPQKDERITMQQVLAEEGAESLVVYAPELQRPEPTGEGGDFAEGFRFFDVESVGAGVLTLSSVPVGLDLGDEPVDQTLALRMIKADRLAQGLRQIDADHQRADALARPRILIDLRRDAPGLE